MISGSNSEVTRARSVEELLPSSPEPTATSDVIPPEGPSSLPARPQPPSKGHGSKFDWENFQEAVCCSYFGVCPFFPLFVFQNQFYCWSAFQQLFTPNFSWFSKTTNKMTSGLILCSECLQEVRNSNFEFGDSWELKQNQCAVISVQNLDLIARLTLRRNTCFIHRLSK